MFVDCPCDFTHVGDACTFETLLDQLELQEPGLSTLAEIIHDIDVKDGKFGRAESPGGAALIAGIALAERDDALQAQLIEEEP
ncbi:MAG: chromate resistance protein [Myxococcota bacterium]|nr:chromate resistance protein [Myxococcota bacterium]